MNRDALVFPMRMILVVVLLTAPLAAIGQEIKPLPSIEATGQRDVASVSALSDTLGTLSEKVTACVNAGRKPETCRCSYPQELSSLRKGYANLIKDHPGWKDQIISYQYVNKGGRNISGSLVLQNLRRQLEVLKCE